MDTLDKKRKRLNFLTELQSRGVEMVNPMIKRTKEDIRFIEISIRLNAIKAERERKIKDLLKK